MIGFSGKIRSSARWGPWRPARRENHRTALHQKGLPSLLTDQSRFLIVPDPFKPGNQSVRMAQLSPKGNPLPDGAVVEGSTSFSLMMEQGSRELQGWSKFLHDVINRLQKEIRRLSEKEWQEELERQLERWTRELERSSEDVRRYFQKEVLPQIERAVRDLLRRLKELEKRWPIFGRET